jgi:hypothetical protein
LQALLAGWTSCQRSAIRHQLIPREELYGWMTQLRRTIRVKRMLTALI